MIRQARGLGVVREEIRFSGKGGRILPQYPFKRGQYR